MKEHEWIVERHEAFAFRGPSGNPASADLALVTRDGSLPVVVATERHDNPGVSITNGAEQLAAHVLMRLFPERIGDQQPFRLVEHYRATSFDSTMQEVRFTDFRLRHDRAAPRIGDVLEWRPLDARVAAVLAEQTVRIEREQPRQQGISDADLSAAIDRAQGRRERERAQQQAIEAPKKSRGMGR